MNTIRKLVLAVSVTATIYIMLGSAVFSYFDDDEISADNTFTTGTWPDIDVDSAILTGNGWTLLHNIFLIPGESDIIDKIVISWTDNKGERVKEAEIGGETFWSGTNSSGDILDGNYVLDKKKHNKYRFDSDMRHKIFTIQLILSDDQIIEKTFEPKWRDEKPEGWNDPNSIGSDNENTNTETVKNDN